MLLGWDFLGLAIRDYYQGDLAAEILVNSSCAGLERMPAAIFFRNYDQMPDLERYALNLCQGSVLDIGAGAGSHALYLQEQGFTVYPVDISPFAVEVMEKRGLHQVRCADIKELTIEPVDTLLMLMNGIGLVGDLAGLKFFLAEIKRLLKSGGQLLIDSADLSHLESQPGSKITKVLKKGKNYGKVRYQLEYRGVKGPPFYWLFVDEDTLNKVAVETGWSFQVVYEEDSQYLARLTPLY